MDEYIKQPIFDSFSAKYINKNKMYDWLDEIKKILDNNYLKQDMKDFSYQDLSDILAITDKISLDCRTMISLKNNDYLLFDKGKDKETLLVSEDKYLNSIGLKDDEDFERKLEELALKDSPVEMSYDGKLFTLYTPLTFKRGFNEKQFQYNYMLSKLVEAHIRKWENDNKKCLYKLMKAPYIIVMKRVDNEFSIFKNCDADNIENQKIINAITRAFYLPDNANVMSLYSIFDVISPKENKAGMYFYVFSQEHLEDYKHLFYKQYNEKVELSNY